jgi:hypothetical protein
VVALKPATTTPPKIPQLLFASSTVVVLAQNGDRIIVPASSIERPEDIGVRVHTNIFLVPPEKVEIGDNGAPIAENPLTLACIYHLVKPIKHQEQCCRSNGQQRDGTSHGLLSFRFGDRMSIHNLACPC